MEKITSLVEMGAKIVGIPPVKSPGLVDYPNCDTQVKAMAEKLWGATQPPGSISEVNYGKGLIFWGGDLTQINPESLYPDYEQTVELLASLKVDPDFRSANNSIRYGHRKTKDKDIWFTANRTGSFQATECSFRALGEPEMWIGTTGEIRKINNYSVKNGITTIPLEYFPYESYFVVFNTEKSGKKPAHAGKGNFPQYKRLMTIEGAWNLLFDPEWGGPEEIKFEKLEDWTKHELPGIKYYSGIVTYKKSFNISNVNRKDRFYFIDLGEVNDIARIKLNGKNMGVIWCAPWRIEITDSIKEGDNDLEIEVANRWINRLLGDRKDPDANVRTVTFENGFLEGRTFLTGRYTFTMDAAMRSFRFTEPLSSGLLGPVTIQEMSK
jgi:hypothetical protein